MIIWIILGYILQWIGHMFRRSDVLFLGYYLAGTGKTRSLPKESISIINTMIEGIEPEPGNTLILNPLEFCNQVLGTSMHGEFQVLFHTIGKFWCIAEKDIIIIKDRYMFYPLCADSHIHFSDCDCQHKEYTRIYRSYYYPHRVRELIKRLTKKEKFSPKCIFNNLVSYDISTISASIMINDEFWVNKGKPFDVYSEIPVNKI